MDNKKVGGILPFIVLTILFIINMFWNKLNLPWEISLIASVITATNTYIIYELTKGRDFTEESLKLTKKLIETKEKINLIRGKELCLKDLVNTLEEAKKEIGENIYIKRFMPIEFSEELFRKKEERRYISKYKNFIEKIVIGGNGNFDQTIYGRAQKAKINRKTFEFVKRVYFGEILPDTSKIGILQKEIIDKTRLFNMMTIFLIGRSTSFDNPEWHYGFLFLGDGKRAPDIGMKTETREIIEFFDRLWEVIQENCTYKDLQAIGNNEKIDLLKTMEENIVGQTFPELSVKKS